MSDQEKPKSNLPAKKEAQIELFEAEEIVRPELNLAKHADRIFISPQSSKVKEIRRYKWDASVAGVTAKAGIKIHPLQGLKTPTTTTYKVFLGLVQIWEKQGKPADGKIVFSGRQLAEVMGLKWDGKLAKRINENLGILAHPPKNPILEVFC